MNKRTRTLAWLALGVAGAWIVGLGLRGFIAAPLKAIDGQITQLRGKLKSAQQERTSFIQAQDFLNGVPARTFGSTPDTAAAEVMALLTRQILEAGLREADFTRIPVGERRLTGAVEIGWIVQGDGPLDRIVDLLFLLDQDPRLHRLESLALSAGGEPGRVRVRFRFLTLLLRPPPAGAVRGTVEFARLDAPERALYVPITRRDLLRPYVPRAPAETGGPVPPPAPSEGEPGPTDPYLNLRDLKVVSLSTWAGQPEVHLRDAAAGQARVVRPGDDLAGVQIVTVDYRAHPRPDKPGLMSYSRVILRQNGTYYAVECGQTLGERRPIEPADLPVDLRE